MSKKSVTTTHEIIKSLARAMGTSTRTILYLIGMDQNGLSLGVHKPFKDMVGTKVGARILKLAAVREFLVKEHAADKYEIIHCLMAPAYRNSKNIIMDFTSALQKDFYSKEDLCHIALTGLRICRGECKIPSTRKKLVSDDIQAAFDRSWAQNQEIICSGTQSDTEKEVIKKKCMAIFMAGIMTYENSEDEEPRENFREKVQNNEVTEKYRTWWEKSSNKDPDPKLSFVAGYNIGKIDGISQVEDLNSKDDELV